MDNSVVLLVVVMSLGAIQGLMFGTLLLNPKIENKTANRILAVILFLLSYRLIMQIMRIFGLGCYDTWYYFMLDLSWAHGALIYLYVMAQTNPQFNMGANTIKHFVPLAVQIAISAFVRIQNIYWDGTRESLSWLGYWGYWLWMNQPTIYIVASILIIIYAKIAGAELAMISPKLNIKDDRLKWLRRIITTFKFYFLMVLVILLGDLVFFKSFNDSGYFYFTRFYYYPFFIGISVLTYWLGLEGFKRMKIEKIKLKRQIDVKKRDQLQQIANNLDHLMSHDKAYLDPQLNLAKVAAGITAKPYLVSKALKEIMHTNFNDFINSYRVNEVKRLLSLPENKKQNLLTIAFAAGFNSKSSFNRAVKNLLGIDPKALKKLD